MNEGRTVFAGDWVKKSGVEARCGCFRQRGSHELMGCRTNGSAVAHDSMEESLLLAIIEKGHQHPAIALAIKKYLPLVKNRFQTDTLPVSRFNF